MSVHPSKLPQLITVTATVRAAEVTPLGHLSCLLEAEGQSYGAIGDPIVASLVELQPGVSVRGVLLRLRRAAPGALWHWQLLCCRIHTPGSPSPAITQTTTVHLEGSHA